MDEARYFQFPLFLLQDLWTDKKECLNNIIEYGLYRFWKYIRNDYLEIDTPADVANSIIYDNYKGKIFGRLREILDNNEWDFFGKDEDYNGFGGLGEFYPIDEVTELESAFENDNELYELAKDHYRKKRTLRYFNIRGGFGRTDKIGKSIEMQIPEKEPMPMVRTSLIFHVRNKEVTEFYLAQFAAHIAIKSILGKKPFAKTNKAHIVARMAGFRSVKDVPKKQPAGLKAIQKKYLHRYHIDKLIQSLELEWNIITYSNHMRGLYVADKSKISLEKLAIISEEKKQKNKIAALKEEKEAAKRKALQHLNKREHLK